MRGFSRASEPGAYLIDTIPWLKYIPDWIPGARFKEDIKAFRQSRERLYDVPYEFTVQDLVWLLALTDLHFLIHDSSVEGKLPVRSLHHIWRK